MSLSSADVAGESSGSQEDQLCTALVNQLNRFADKETLIQFLRCFLLESNSSSVRWQAHCLTLHIYRWARAGSGAGSSEFWSHTHGHYSNICWFQALEVSLLNCLLCSY